MSELEMLANRVIVPAEAPDQVLILPAGSVSSSSGNFRVTAESLGLIQQRIAAAGVEIPLDYEHHSVGGEFAAPDGRAVAAGWIKSLQWTDGGIVASVEWTPAAAQMIRDKEYRYLSPVVLVRGSDGLAIGLHSVALTNKPAIAGMRPIVNKSQKENHMQDIVKLLGLADGADEAAVCKAIRELQAAADASRAGDSAAAQIAAHKQQIEALAASHRATAEALQSAQAELKALRDASAAGQAESRIARAIEEGRLTEAMLACNEQGRNFFRELARDESAWAEFIGRQPVIAPPSAKRFVAAGAAKPESGESREALIANSTREFRSDAEHARITSCAAWVNQTLREKGLPLLTAEERGRLAA